MDPRHFLNALRSNGRSKKRALPGQELPARSQVFLEIIPRPVVKKIVLLLRRLKYPIIYVYNRTNSQYNEFITRASLASFNLPYNFS
jgi:hypothetical protein